MIEQDADDQAAAWPLAAPVAVYLLAFAAMTSPWILGRVSIPWDSKAHFLPQVQFLAQSFWAGEWPWLSRAAEVITRALGGSVAVTVSTRRTDPWTLHHPGPSSGDSTG